MANLVARCPNPECANEFEPPSKAAMKAKIAGAGFLGGAAIGAAVGAGFGIAGGGIATVATVPTGIAGSLIIGLGAKVGADWALATATCPECSTTFRL